MSGPALRSSLAPEASACPARSSSVCRHRGGGERPAHRSRRLGQPGCRDGSIQQEVCKGVSPASQAGYRALLHTADYQRHTHTPLLGGAARIRPPRAGRAQTAFSRRLFRSLPLLSWLESLRPSQVKEKIKRIRDVPSRLHGDPLKVLRVVWRQAGL